MVKIYLPDAASTEAQYLLDVQHELSKRITALKDSLDHLAGKFIDKTSIGYEYCGGFTEKIINEIEGAAIFLSKDFNQKPYPATIAKYMSIPNNLSKFNFLNVGNLLDKLLANNETCLKKLLTCQPSDLLKYNLSLGWGGYNTFEISIIQLLFSRENQKYFWNKFIREFFKEHVPVQICPYCNFDLVEHIKSSSGAAYTFALDHFYNQIDYPLLCYSFYNLIPADTNCNSIKKLKIEFSDEFHLHPYLYDYGQHASFKATYRPPFSKVDDLELIVHAAPKSDMYKRMLGDVPIYSPGHKNGNINVFKINDMYKGKHFLGQAQYTLESLRNMTSTLGNLQKFMLMFRLDSQERNNAYKCWYEKKLRSSFSKTQFTDKPLSKMNRDLHDAHISRTKFLKLYIEKMIAKDNELA